MTATTSEWVQKAESDYVAVCILRRSRKPGRLDAICFHCQQCAEKYLKGRLNEAGISPPKTHDLALLLRMNLPLQPLWAPMELALRDLSNYAVAIRYPDKPGSKSDAAEAFRVCAKMRQLSRTSLGLPT
jgi:HEPN domain-containing protein